MTSLIFQPSRHSILKASRRLVYSSSRISRPMDFGVSVPTSLPVAFSSSSASSSIGSNAPVQTRPVAASNSALDSLGPSITSTTNTTKSNTSTSTKTSSSTSAKPRPSAKLRKAALFLDESAVERMKELEYGDPPKLVRVGVRNKGCAGLAYHLEYIDKPGRFDEIVEQDGVTVVVDSRALFSIIGSKMKWVNDGIGERFVFENPNIVDACGCGESFNV